MTFSKKRNSIWNVITQHHAPLPPVTSHLWVTHTLPSRYVIRQPTYIIFQNHVPRICVWVADSLTIRIKKRIIGATTTCYISLDILLLMFLMSRQLQNVENIFLISFVMQSRCSIPSYAKLKTEILWIFTNSGNETISLQNTMCNVLGIMYVLGTCSLW